MKKLPLAGLLLALAAAANAQDFRVTPGNREDLWRHCAEITEVVLEAGGKFYFAKDLVIGYQDLIRFFPPAKLEAFLEMKRELDPDCRLQTNLWRRVFVPAEERAAANAPHTAGAAGAAG